ncbi:hypothetical protein B0J14DRAFT_575524 [Halenospora varia]|nr:hypothetical protein B0J14DRAFT_575524 [Halenospora varia]
MGNYVSTETYLRTDSCSARNITWQYIHYSGELPAAYLNCTDVKPILQTHCCYNKTCHPNSIFDNEFKRYEWKDWDGLGPPGGVGVQWGLSCWSGFHGDIAENVTVPVVGKRDVVVVERSVVEVEASPQAAVNQPLVFSTPQPPSPNDPDEERERTIEYDTTVWMAHRDPPIISAEEGTPVFEERGVEEEKMIPAKTFDGAPVFPKPEDHHPVSMAREEEAEGLATGDAEKFGPFTHPIITPPPRHPPMLAQEDKNENSKTVVEHLIPGIPPLPRPTPPNHPPVLKRYNKTTDDGRQSPQQDGNIPTSTQQDTIRTTFRFATITPTPAHPVRRVIHRFDHDLFAEPETETRKHLRKPTLEDSLNQVGVMESQGVQYLSFDEYSRLSDEEKKYYNSGGEVYQRMPQPPARATPLLDDKTLDGESFHDEVWNNIPPPHDVHLKLGDATFKDRWLLKFKWSLRVAAVLVVMGVICLICKYGRWMCKSISRRWRTRERALPCGYGYRQIARKKRNSNDSAEMILAELGMVNDQPMARNVTLTEEVRFDVPLEDLRL